MLDNLTADHWDQLTHQGQCTSFNWFERLQTMTKDDVEQNNDKITEEILLQNGCCVAWMLNEWQDMAFI